MAERLVLVVSRDPTVRLDSRVESWTGPAELRFLKSDVEAASDLVRARAPSALVFIQSAAGEAADVSELLGVCNEARTRIPVVVVVETYDEIEATAYFRMGVEDYLSLRDHADCILGVLAGIALRHGGGRVVPEIAPSFGQPYRPNRADVELPVVT